MNDIVLFLICACGGALVSFVVTWLVKRADVRAVKTELDVVRTQSESRAARLQTLLDEKAALTGAVEASERELRLLKEQMAHSEEQRMREVEEQNARFLEQLRLAQEQLKGETEQLLRKRSEELTGKNSEQLSHILNPLKDSMKQMEEAMKSNRESQINTSAALRQTIDDMMRQTKDVASEANNLANALRGRSKMQGNWGELVLSELLESQGLTEGVQFTVQEALRNEQGSLVKSDEGHILMPDVVLHLATERMSSSTPRCRSAPLLTTGTPTTMPRGRTPSTVICRACGSTSKSSPGKTTRHTSSPRESRLATSSCSCPTRELSSSPSRQNPRCGGSLSKRESSLPESRTFLQHCALSTWRGCR